MVAVARGGGGSDLGLPQPIVHPADGLSVDVWAEAVARKVDWAEGGGEPQLLEAAVKALRLCEGDQPVTAAVRGEEGHGVLSGHGVHGARRAGKVEERRPRPGGVIGVLADRGHRVTVDRDAEDHRLRGVGCVVT